MAEASLLSSPSHAAPERENTSEAMVESRVQTAQEALCQRFQLASVRAQIRVLHIQKANGTGDDPIVAKMKVIDIVAERNRYNALSYVWGSGFEPESIVCEGWIVPVHKNCYSAIYHLRRKLGSFCIWIDALCINQDDQCAEKESQIHLMTEIYANACSVYVWLGIGSSRTRAAMSFFRRASLKKYLKEAKNDKRHERIWIAACHNAVIPWLLPSNMRPGQSIMLPLLDTPWLQRMWTYQEMLFASQPIIVCGNDHVTWQTFQDGLLRLSLRKDRQSIEYLRDWVGLLSAKTWPVNDTFTHRHERFREVMSNWLGLGEARERCALEKETFTLSERREFLKRVSNRRVFLQLSFAMLFVLSAIGNIAANANGAAFTASIAVSLFVISNVLLPILSGASQDVGGVSTVGALAEGVYHRKATKPFDKAYGVWNILRRLGVRGLPHESEKVARSKLYHHLAASLLKCTEDLDILRFAAVSPLSPEQTNEKKVPTWVPNWAHENQNELEVKRHRMLVDMDGYPLVSETNAILLRPYEAETNKVFGVPYLDTAEDLLTVSARALGIVSSCLLFYDASSALDSRDELVRSVQAGALFVKVLRALDIDLDQVLESAGGQGTTSASERSNWLRMMSSTSLYGTDRMATHFLSSKGLLDQSSGFVLTHAKLCKLLGQAGYMVCKISFFGRPDDDFYAICRGPVQEDDLVLRIRGVLQPLVVRRALKARDKSVSLVSALTMNTRALESAVRSDLPPIEQVVIR